MTKIQHASKLNNNIIYERIIPETLRIMRCSSFIKTKNFCVEILVLGWLLHFRYNNYCFVHFSLALLTHICIYSFDFKTKLKSNLTKKERKDQLSVELILAHCVF